jgi:hypothetical protein
MKLNELIADLQNIQLTHARDMEVTIVGRNPQLEAPIVKANTRRGPCALSASSCNWTNDLIWSHR